MYGCELDDNDGTTTGTNQYGYDGEDFISLDLNAGNWIAAKPQALVFKKGWESTGAEMKYWKSYLKFECVHLLQKYVSYSEEALERQGKIV